LPSPSARPSAAKVNARNPRIRLAAGIAEKTDVAVEEVEYQYEFEEEPEYPKWMDGVPPLVQSEELWEVDDNGDIWRQYYSGNREAGTVIIAIACLLFGPGFLIVAASLYFDDSIVDWNPITSNLLWFLRIDDQGQLPFDQRTQYYPQGMFMTIWGSIFTFLVGPVYFYWAISDTGRGVMEVRRKEKKIYIVKNGYCERELNFKDIQSVNLRWAPDYFLDLPLDDRELFIIMKDGTYVQFEDQVNKWNRPREVLEVRGARLARYIGVPMTVLD